MSYQCEIKERAPQPVLAIRARVKGQDLPQMLGQSFGAVAQYLGELGEQPAGAPFAAYYNMDMENLDVEAGFPVARPLPGRGAIQAGEIPGGLSASVVHVGPYADCGPAYEALTQFVKDQGHTATGVAYEMYLNDPAVTPPAQLMTQVVFPLQPVLEKP
jgi:effector-binding domain-containing protein